MFRRNTRPEFVLFAAVTKRNPATETLFVARLADIQKMQHLLRPRIFVTEEFIVPLTQKIF
jgi:hypothetical protein